MLSVCIYEYEVTLEPQRAGRTVAKENLTLPSWRVRVRVCIGFTKFVVGLDINV